jgi:glycosyltransferase involved in cell wall biosynthesis
VKIALIRHMMDDAQGGARLVAWLARDLREMGEDVTLYCYGYDEARCFPDVLADVPVRYVHRLDASTGEPRRFEAGWRRSWAQLRRYYREAPAVASLIDPLTEIVNPHEWLAHRSAAIFGRARAVPIVWTYNDPSHWHVHSGWGLRELPYRALGWLDTRQINRFAAVTTLSRWMAEVGARAFDAPVHVVRCGIDVRDLPAPARSTTHGGGRAMLRLLSVGVLAPGRGFEDAIRAVAVARRAGCECHYEIIGSDRFWPSYGARLRALVAELGLRDVVTLRFQSISESELERAYARSDVAVFPNVQQAWGLAQLEAMVRGIPLVVSRGAGVSEVLTDGENALLVDPRRPDQLAGAILQLAAAAPLRRELADRGRALVLESYTSVHYARRMFDVFRGCLAPRPPN